MAKIGLKYPVYAIATEGESTTTYSSPAVLAKAITADVSIESTDVKLPADDGIAESIREFVSGSISFEIDTLSDTALVNFLGYTEGDTADAAISSKVLSLDAGVTTPFVGIGYYTKESVRNVNYWQATWLPKVQFAFPGMNSKTKGESIEFQTHTLEGTVFKSIENKAVKVARFSTEAKAKAWLDGICGLATKCATPTSSVASGSYAGAQSVTLSTATASATIYYTTDGTVPSATNGTSYSTAIACADPSNTCIKAVATKTDYTNSDILELYITVTE